MKTHNWENRLELGEYLRAWREEQGLTQRALAKKMGVSPQWITLVERGGVSSPTVPMIRLMSETYGIEIDELEGAYFPRPLKKDARASNPAVDAVQ